MSTLIKTLLLVLDELFNFVFPLSEDEQRIKTLTDERMKQKLFLRRINDINVLSSFADDEMRALLHLIKFHRHSRALKLVGTLFASWLHDHAEESCIIIPIPLSNERLRSRGYNQTELIAKAAIRFLPHNCIDTTILSRSRDTKPQTTLRRSERLRNMTGAFSVSPHASSLQDVHIILLDDVMTTGATIQAAKAALQGVAPKSITCVAIAH